MNGIGLVAGLLTLAAVVYFLALIPARRRAARVREQATVKLRAEELQIRKTRAQLADVTTHTEVVRELKTVTVPVTREELVVAKDGVEAARIPLCEEQVDVSTRKVPLNDVAVYKQEWEEEQEIEAVLKREVARVETTGDATYTEAPGSQQQV